MQSDGDLSEIQKRFAGKRRIKVLGAPRGVRPGTRVWVTADLHKWAEVIDQDIDDPEYLWVMFPRMFGITNYLMRVHRSQVWAKDRNRRRLS